MGAIAPYSTVTRLGKWTGEVAFVEKRIWEPTRWKNQRVFTCNMSDLFHELVPDEWIDQVWASMMLSPSCTFFVLTKRIERAAAYLNSPRLYSAVLHAAEKARALNPRLSKIGLSDPTHFRSAPWIWVGTTIENNQAREERLHHLARIPYPHWISMEPLLEAPDMTRADLESAEVRWVVQGGESGPDARSSDVEWFQAILNVCEAAKVPAFMKQLGAKPKALFRVRHRSGADMEEWPERLRIRQFPVFHQQKPAPVIGGS